LHKNRNKSANPLRPQLAALRFKMEFIEQSKFLPRIEEIFDELSHRLRSMLPNSRIEHVGSSSIPGTISKGDLDIFVGVSPLEFEQSISLVQSIGFYEKSDTMRTESLRMMVTDEYQEDVAIQIVSNGTEFECFIDFRDKMRSNPELVSKYNELKINCNGMPHEQYREVKSSFIESVLNEP
jgi:GrpB-like predicted nucleotidyltransferase (UPF0157 family)